MDNKTIETLSVNAVRDSIVVSGFLDPFIADNDKEPSWDGVVYIYKDKDKNKKNLKGRLPVQVKGTKNDDFSKEEISFPISVIDLKNYLYDGGVVFFVVYIGENGLTKQIYYTELPPIKIRVILSEAGEQKTKNIKMIKFPNDPNKKAMIFLNCLDNCKKQSSFSSAKLFSLEELEKQGVLESVTIPVSTVGSIDPKTALLTNQVYIYANIKGISIPQPLETIPEKLMTQEEITAQITVGDRVFYDKLTIFQDANTTTTVLGESFFICANKGGSSVTIRYRSYNKIRTLATDLDFILSYISQGSFQYNGVNISFDSAGADLSNFSLEDETIRLEYVKKIIQMLDMLECKKDIDINTLKDQDWRNINYLVTALVDKQPVTGLKEDLPGILSIFIGDLKFVFYLQKVDGCKGTYNLFDFFKTDLNLVYENHNGVKLAISQYAILHADDLINADNIRFDVLLPSFQNAERHSETMIRANLFLLELLKAYDKSEGRTEIINTARDFSDWIMTATEEELPYDIRLLNKLQIVKRLRPLNIDEIKELFHLVEAPHTSKDIIVGAYLLLDQQPTAEIYFKQLEKQQQKDFEEFPIYYFWKKDGDAEREKG